MTIRATIERGLRLAVHPVALAAVAVAGSVFIWQAENQLLSLPFALTIFAALTGGLFLASRRLGFSLYASLGIIAVITVISALKYKMKGFSLHFYDFVFFTGDTEVHRFLVHSYLHLILPVLVTLALCIAGAVAVFRAAPASRVRAPVRLGLFAVPLVLLPMTVPVEAVDERVFYYMRGRNMSAFFVSLIDLRHLFERNELEARLRELPPQPPFADIVDCGDRSKLPDIYFVLSETQTDPAIFPEIKSGKGFLQRFAPLTDKPMPMSVETFGGGTWITNLSLMSGLSATDFGWRSPYLTLLLENHIRGALPELLARCGYRTASMTPMAETFVNDGPFMHSIGFDRIVDIEDIAAPHYHMRDSFYYGKAEEFIARHRAEDGRPLFLEIQTMFPHSPYQDRLEPDILVSGEPFAEEPEIAEYLRRMAIAREDLEIFLEKRQAEAETKPSLVLEFGDHQSAATRPLVDRAAGKGATGKARSLAYQTYYTLTGFGHELRTPSPHFDVLDVGFLGPTLLEAAGLPMSPLMADLVELRDHCEGRFYTCEDRAAVDRHLRRRIDSGMLTLIEAAPAATLVAAR